MNTQRLVGWIVTMLILAVMMLSSSAQAETLQPNGENHRQELVNLVQTANQQGYCIDLVSETLPDGSVLHRGQTYMKQFTIVNCGTKALPAEYGLVKVYGNLGERFLPFNKVLKPGKTITLTTPIVVPENWAFPYAISVYEAGVNHPDQPRERQDSFLQPYPVFFELVVAADPPPA